jgi:transcriptional repressor NrdR
VGDLEELVNRVEAKVYDEFEREAPAQAIGELVSEELKDLDQVAFVRFASVYRRFTDISGFEEVLKVLLRKDAKTDVRKDGARASNTRDPEA